ncbi:patatin-like phospholipase family protein [Roseivirga sp. BDSF3-8]|uniref:patatin-like phospholipase family protein n=1 Tax=Roseivirga sp. BDSF3-8 TaxID=3241598 RepID=UPI003531AEFA
MGENENRQPVTDTGLVISGGGARTIMSIGVLQALEESGVKVGCVAGTSMGAVIGALYAAGLSPAAIREVFRGKQLAKTFSLRIPRLGFLQLDFLREVLKSYIRTDNFNYLQKPLYVSTTNINTGENVIFKSGTLYDKVLASATLPVLFEPVQIGDHYYVDGGLTNNFPVDCIRDCCKKLIGVHVNCISGEQEVNGMAHIIARTFALAVWQTVKDKLKACDHLIEPKQARNYTIFDFGKADELFEIGYEATMKGIEEIKAPCHTPSPNGWISTFRKRFSA